MDFEDNAQLDSSQVTDRRGIGGGRGLALGGGGLGIVGLQIDLVLGVNPADLTGSGITTGTAGAVSSAELQARCRTGADANRDEDCRIVGIANSVQDYWTAAFGAAGKQYVKADTVLCTGQTGTGCGATSTAVAGNPGRSRATLACCCGRSHPAKGPPLRVTGHAPWKGVSRHPGKGDTRAEGLDAVPPGREDAQ